MPFSPDEINKIRQYCFLADMALFGPEPVRVITSNLDKDSIDMVIRIYQSKGWSVIHDQKAKELSFTKSRSSYCTGSEKD